MGQEDETGARRGKVPNWVDEKRFPPTVSATKLCGRKYPSFRTRLPSYESRLTHSVFPDDECSYGCRRCGASPTHDVFASSLPRGGIGNAPWLSAIRWAVEWPIPLATNVPSRESWKSTGKDITRFENVKVSHTTLMETFNNILNHNRVTNMQTTGLK